MTHFRNFAFIALVVVLSAAGVQPQQGTNTTTSFEKVAVVFDVPAGWRVTESNLVDEQLVMIRPESGPTEIVVSSKNTFTCDFEAELKSITATQVSRLARLINSASSVQTSAVKIEVNGADVEGKRLLGVVDGKRLVADVYSVRQNLRFVSIVYIRAEDDNAAGAAWDTVRTTLKVEPNVRTAAGSAGGNSRGIIKGGVLNGKAISLPRPSYPPIARQAHASGVVVVQVTIDETGAVMAAHAVSGHPLLQGVSVQAARDARFSPTKLCNEPVKVSGVITYNFVVQ